MLISLKVKIRGSLSKTNFPFWEERIAGRMYRGNLSYHRNWDNKTLSSRGSYVVLVNSQKAKALSTPRSSPARLSRMHRVPSPRSDGQLRTLVHVNHAAAADPIIKLSGTSLESRENRLKPQGKEGREFDAKANLQPRKEGCQGVWEASRWRWDGMETGKCEMRYNGRKKERKLNFWSLFFPFFF